MIRTRIDDLRLVVPPGQKPPPGQPGPSNPVVPSYEYPEVEDWQDQDEEEGEGTGDPDLDKMLGDYDDSVSSDLDDAKEEILDRAQRERDERLAREAQEAAAAKAKEGEEPGKEGDMQATGRKAGTGMGNQDIHLKATPGDIKVTSSGIHRPFGAITSTELDIFNQRRAENTRKAINHEKYSASALRKALAKQTKSDAGHGLMGEFGAIGHTPPQTGIWKQALKKWIASIIKEHVGPSWVYPNIRTSSVTRQLRSMGSNAKIQTPEAPARRPNKYSIIAMVDVSGSVFNMRIQSEFAKVLKGAPHDKVEISIFTFDGGVQEGPYTPFNYYPKKGGGGTDLYGSMRTILDDPKYANPDGIVVLTDGEFGGTAPVKGKQLCFILTKSNSKQAIPAGAKVIDTSIEAD
jgi:hypothetical protein